MLGGAIVASVIVVGVLMAGAGMTVSPWAASDRPYYFCGILALALRYALRRSSHRVANTICDCAVTWPMFTLIALVGAISSYPLAAHSHGYADAALERIDLTLHFDWLAWYETVAAHPALQLACRLAYESIYVSPALLLGYFAWSGRRLEARAFLASFWLAAVMTLVLFRFMPAVGPLAFLWHGPVPYMPESALWQPMLIPELRHNAVHSIDVGSLRGLVSAPSFHTAAAVLYIAAARRVRRLRVPLTLLNAAMLVATPVEGTHYLTDMIAGALVALTALGLHQRLGLSAPLAARS